MVYVPLVLSNPRNKWQLRDDVCQSLARLEFVYSKTSFNYSKRSCKVTSTKGRDRKRTCVNMYVSTKYASLFIRTLGTRDEEKLNKRAGVERK